MTRLRLPKEFKIFYPFNFCLHDLPHLASLVEDIVALSSGVFRVDTLAFSHKRATEFSTLL
ncbi:hypothetical protein VDIAB_100077 [Vibrio diabolicus]|nr:hypothetical protein VDIAB_100077 [Vibrio diabolicus]